MVVTDSGIKFSIIASAAWAPGVETPEDWLDWSLGRREITGETEPAVRAMAPMLRRRAGFLDRMALEVAYRCLGDRRDVPIVFCSRHGEADRSVSMLSELAKGQPLSPTAFGMSVHNAVGGLFSIARADRAHHVALAAGQSSVEHGVIEAGTLLADGEPAVLLVVYDCPLPPVYRAFEDCHEQPFAWAWLMEPNGARRMTLAWSPIESSAPSDTAALPGGLEIWRFYLRREHSLERRCDGRRWVWSSDV